MSASAKSTNADDIELGRFSHGETAEVRVAWRCYRDRWQLDVRNYFKDESGTWLPTKKGATVRAEELEQLGEWIRRAQQLAEQPE